MRNTFKWVQLSGVSLSLSGWLGASSTQQYIITHLGKCTQSPGWHTRERRDNALHPWPAPVANHGEFERKQNVWRHDKLPESENNRKQSNTAGHSTDWHFDQSEGDPVPVEPSTALQTVWTGQTVAVISTQIEIRDLDVSLSSHHFPLDNSSSSWISLVPAVLFWYDGLSTAFRTEESYSPLFFFFFQHGNSFLSSLRSTYHNNIASMTSTVLSKSLFLFSSVPSQTLSSSSCSQR